MGKNRAGLDGVTQMNDRGGKNEQGGARGRGRYT